MNWQDWIEAHQFDIDMGDDTFDLMKQMYIAGLQQAYDMLYSMKTTTMILSCGS